jgi:hypothetical protein
VDLSLKRVSDHVGEEARLFGDHSFTEVARKRGVELKGVKHD